MRTCGGHTKGVHRLIASFNGDESAATFLPVFSPQGDRVAIEPEAGVLGRAIVNCGVREVHLDCDLGGDLWRYRWVIPQGQASSELNDVAIENLVEELLKS